MDPKPAAAPAAPSRIPNGYLAALLFAVVIALGILGVMVLYNAETETSAASLKAGNDTEADRIEVFTKVVSVDPIKGELSCRLEFLPHGGYTHDEGRTLALPLKLTVNSATGKGEYDFPKGKKMSPVEVVLNLYDNQVMDYPFDEHKAQLILDFEVDEVALAKELKKKAKEKGAAHSASAGKDPDEESSEADSPKDDLDELSDELETVVMDFELRGSIAGLKISGQENKESSADYLMFDLKIQRSATVIGYALFVMGAMWLLSLSVLRLLWSAIFAGRKIEVGMFSFLGAMLFAFPALRNSQPGVPALGTYSDFLSFFWAEGLIAFTLLALITAFLRTPPK